VTTRVVPGRAAVGADQPARVPRRVVARNPADLVRVGLGLAIVGVGLLIAQRGHLPVFERDVFQLVNDLPPALFPVVWAVMQLGNVIAVPVLAAAAALTRRWGMARDLLVSGLLAYLAADLVKSLVRRERPGGFAVDPFFPEGPIGGLGFISGHAAVAAALATAAAPYLWAGLPPAGRSARWCTGCSACRGGSPRPGASPRCCAATGCPCTTSARRPWWPGARTRSRPATRPDGGCT
jgi:undecaprenyl-diphosphatase